MWYRLRWENKLAMVKKLRYREEFWLCCSLTVDKIINEGIRGQRTGCTSRSCSNLKHGCHARTGVRTTWSSMAGMIVMIHNSSHSGPT